MNQTNPSESPTRCAQGPLELARNTGVVCGIVLLFVIAALGVAYGIDVLLMLFAGLLFSVFLLTLCEILERYTGLPHPWSLVVVVVALLVIVAVSAWLVFPTISAQVEELGKVWPKSLSNFRTKLHETKWGTWAVRHVPDTKDLEPQLKALAARTTGVVSSVVGATGMFVIVLVVGLMLAAQPTLYRNSALSLLPRARRNRAQEVLRELGDTLKWWIIAQCASMLIIGVLTWLGLLALGIPLAAFLAIAAAFLTFIPNFGPIASAIPAILLGLLQGPWTAACVIALYLTVQTLESNVITPSIQYRALALPPVLVVASQLMIGVWTGILGLALASPLLSVAMVLTRMLYIQDVLKEEPQG